MGCPLVSRVIFFSSFPTGLATGLAIQRDSSECGSFAAAWCGWSRVGDASMQVCSAILGVGFALVANQERASRRGGGVARCEIADRARVVPSHNARPNPPAGCVQQRLFESFSDNDGGEKTLWQGKRTAVESLPWAPTPALSQCRFRRGIQWSSDGRRHAENTCTPFASHHTHPLPCLGPGIGPFSFLNLATLHGQRIWSGGGLLVEARRINVVA